MTKPIYAPILDEQEADELTAGHENIGTPFTFKPNGHLLAESKQLAKWRARPREQKQ